MAIRVAHELGLACEKPELLHLGNHTSVRLSPWPVVARIASGTSFDFSSEGLTRELKVGAHLAARGAPTVGPTTEVEPGPYLEHDCAITLWQFVDGREVLTEAEAILAARALSRVHSALSDIEVAHPSFLTKVESCEEILADPTQASRLAAADRQFLQQLYGRLREGLSSVGGRWQPLHGDTHLGNVRIGESGPIWMDLESVCRGPLEWDVVNLPSTTWSAFPGMDDARLRLFADVRSLCIAVWCWAEFDRSDACREAATFHLDDLKKRFGRT